MDESMYKSALENPVRAESEDRQSIHSDNTTIFDREDHYGDELDDDYSGPQWVWLTMGACKVDPSHLPASWFVENVSSQQSLSGEAWRMNILQVIFFIREENTVILLENFFLSFRVSKLIIQNWNHMILVNTRMQWNVPVGSAKAQPVSFSAAKAPNGRTAVLN